MNAPIGLPANFAVDAGAVRDGVASGKSFGKLVGVIRADESEGRPGKVADAGIRAIKATGDENSFMAVRSECAGDIATDETGASSDGDFHRLPPFHAAKAYMTGKQTNTTFVEW